MRCACIALTLIATVAFLGCATTRDKHQGDVRQVEQSQTATPINGETRPGLSDAFGLLGSIESIGGKVEGMAAVLDMSFIAREALADKALSEGWPLAARNIAAKYKTAILTGETTRHPKMDAIRDVLGKEDATEIDASKRITWYIYGWCGFGATDTSTVTTIRADCARLLALRKTRTR